MNPLAVFREAASKQPVVSLFWIVIAAGCVLFVIQGLKLNPPVAIGGGIFLLLLLPVLSVLSKEPTTKTDKVLLTVIKFFTTLMCMAVVVVVFCSICFNTPPLNIFWGQPEPNPRSTLGASNAAVSQPPSPLANSSNDTSAAGPASGMSAAPTVAATATEDVAVAATPNAVDLINNAGGPQTIGPLNSPSLDDIVFAFLKGEWKGDATISSPSTLCPITETSSLTLDFLGKGGASEITGNFVDTVVSDVAYAIPEGLLSQDDQNCKDLVMHMVARGNNQYRETRVTRGYLFLDRGTRYTLYAEAALETRNGAAVNPAHGRYQYGTFSYVNDRLILTSNRVWELSRQ